MINYYYSNSDTNYSQIFEDLNLAEYSKCIVFLNGEIGSGKTSIVRSYIKLFNLNKTITSPTFTLINEYQLDQTKIFHYDLYKIKRAQELIDIGINDYLNQNALHFFEWPKNCASLLPRPNVIIDLINVHSGRLIKVTIKPNE
tara:strand:+ start:77 stop:505 length:429 start_codon:yes stop_codon:yes gene_type:complete